MATSCMGMSIGTQDFLKDGLLFVRKSHLLSSILTVMPSLFLIYGTDGDYLKILQLASYFALYLLVILPSWLVYKKRKDDRWGPLMILMIALTLAVHAFINQFYFIS
jgi:amino acid permease